MQNLHVTLGVLIPILAIVGGVAIPLLWIRHDYATKQKLIEARHKERLAAIERGMEYPIEPLESMFPSFKTKDSNRPLALLWGLILTFGGVAIIFGRSNLQSGSIILAVGAALLLYHFLVKQQTSSSDENTKIE